MVSSILVVRGKEQLINSQTRPSLIFLPLMLVSFTCLSSVTLPVICGAVPSWQPGMACLAPSFPLAGSLLLLPSRTRLSPVATSGYLSSTQALPSVYAHIAQQQVEAAFPMPHSHLNSLWPFLFLPTRSDCTTHALPCFLDTWYWTTRYTSI